MSQHHAARAASGNSNTDITFISFQGTYNSTTGANLVLTVPSGVQAGDLLIVVGANSRTGGGVTWTAPAGFTLSFDLGSPPNLLIAYRVATGTESATYTFTASNATAYCSGTMLCYRNAKWLKYTTDTSTTQQNNTSLTINGDSTLSFSKEYAIVAVADNTTQQFFDVVGYQGRTADTDIILPSWAVFDSPQSGPIADPTITFNVATTVATGLMLVLIQKDTVLFSAYSSTTITGASTTATSNSFTIQNGSGPVVLGSGVTFSKNGGAYSSSGSVTAGDVITLQATAPATNDTSVVNTFSVNGTTYNWTITTQTYQIFTSSGTFTVPQGVTSVSMLAMGAGGGGGNGRTTTQTVLSTTYYAAGGGGGGGGALSYTNSVTVTPGESLTITVGTGGGIVTAGGTSSISRGATVLVSALGGGGGGTAPGTSRGGGGVGGSTGGVGTVKFAGGNGGAGGGGTLSSTSSGSAYDNGGWGGGPGKTSGGGAAGQTGSYFVSGGQNYIVGGASGQSVVFATTSYSVTTPTQTTALNGKAGNNYGAGGGGGAAVYPTAYAGASGSGGSVVLLWGGRTFSVNTTY